jgi:voltage-gated potassium channel
MIPAAPTAGASLRERAAEVIFGQQTAAGKAFDLVSIVVILASVVTVMLETVDAVNAAHGPLLRTAEWVFTVVFTVEYGFRLWSAPRRLRYAASAFGVIDLLAILPTWLATLWPGAQALVSIRALRVLRIFRILKLGQYVSEEAQLRQALRRSRAKITVFLVAVLTLVAILGSVMYLVEGPEHGFTSIPVAAYWAVVTLTTVGYGDLSPQTPLGRALASCVMVLGYAIIAVPTGIVTVELGNVAREGPAPRTCPGCGHRRHDRDARFCDRCGTPLG